MGEDYTAETATLSHARLTVHAYSLSRYVVVQGDHDCLRTPPSEPPLLEAAAKQVAGGSDPGPLSIVFLARQL